MHPNLRTVLCGVVALSPLAGQASVRTVDDDAPADFTTIDDAIAASGAGDVILVRSGLYEPFTMAGIGVSILADSNASVTVAGTANGNAGTSTSTIRDVPLGQVALVRGIQLIPHNTSQTSSPSTIGPLLHIEDCGGVVQIEDVDADGRSAVPFLFTLRQLEAVLIERSDSVLLARVDVHGSTGTSISRPAIGSRAMTCIDSTVLVHGGTFVSGETVAEGLTGSSGTDVRGGLAVFRDCDITGGVGGRSGASGQPSAGMGGPGVSASAGANLWSIGTILSGGPGGGSTVFGGPSGPSGRPFELLSAATLNELTAQPTSLETTSIVRVDPMNGGPGTLELQGVPGATSVLIVDFIPTPAFVPFFPGFLGVSIGALAIPTGATDASGNLAVPIIAPQLPGLATWQLAVQFATASPSGVLDLSNPSIMTIVQ